jgi:dihydroflavonol-4-reductase
VPPDAHTFENQYFKSKVLAEEAIADFLKRSSLPVVLMLPGWMWGPGDAAPTASGQLVLDFLNRNLPAVPPGGGAPVDVRDVAQAMIAAVEHGRSGERYIVGNDKAVSFAELTQLLQQASGVPAPRIHLPYPVALGVAWLAERWSALTGRPTLLTVKGLCTLRHPHLTNSAKAVRELGATFRPFSETVRDEVAWYREHQPERLQQGRVAAPVSPVGKEAA